MTLQPPRRQVNLETSDDEAFSEPQSEPEAQTIYELLHMPRTISPLRSQSMRLPTDSESDQEVSFGFTAAAHVPPVLGSFARHESDSDDEPTTFFQPTIPGPNTPRRRLSLPGSSPRLNNTQTPPPSETVSAAQGADASPRPVVPAIEEADETKVC